MDKHIAERYKRLEKLEKKYARLFYKALRLDVEPAVQAYLHTADVELAVAMVTSKHVKTVLQALYLAVIQAEAKYEYLHLVSEQKALPSLPVSDWLRRARNFLAIESSKLITNITSTTRNQVKKVLKEAVITGESIPEQAKAMQAKVAQFSRKRAVKIARTESIGAQNYGSLQGALSTGLALDKIWLATAGARTRDTHAEANGQRVDINALFSVGGDSARFPADPSLSAAERINCRCVCTYKRKNKPIQGSFNF